MSLEAKNSNFTLTAMNVFVTGGAGYIGSVFVEELRNGGYDVTVYDNLTEGHHSAVDRRAQFIPPRPDLKNDATTAVKIARVEAIIHLAGNSLVGESKLLFEKILR